jgi:hypothetical protein
MNQDFIESKIRAYREADHPIPKGLALISIGLHAGLIKEDVVWHRLLTQEEKLRVVYFVKQFSVVNGLPPIES